jgi:asparagine synthase (glutamine-hydrolysing)
VDIEHGVQPFYTNNGFLAFGNGEIYNSYELSNQLELSTEVVAKIGFNDIKIAAELLSTDPRRNWEKLDGMFSILLYSPKGEIYFGRDRVGEKPAFYYVSGSRLIVGSSAEV